MTTMLPIVLVNVRYSSYVTEARQKISKANRVS